MNVAPFKHGRKPHPRRAALTGKRFGRLIASRAVGHHVTRAIVWECSCDCGIICLVLASNLISGQTKSCGCLAAESVRDPRNKHSLPGDAALINSAIRHYKGGARSRGLAFSLTDTQARTLLLGPCAYCGRSPDRQLKLPQRKSPPSVRVWVSGIDRKDNSLGYLAENTCSCCSICNKAKNALSIEDWRAWIADLVAYQNRIAMEQTVVKETV